MKIKALRILRTDAGTVRRGGEITLPDSQAKSLIKRGLASEVAEAGDKAPKAEKPHVAAKPKPESKTEKPPAKAGSTPAKGE